MTMFLCHCKEVHDNTAVPQRCLGASTRIIDGFAVAMSPDRVRPDTTPCASGAHFRGNCQCIGPRGLRHRREDEQLGIKRDWGWYYEIYSADDVHACYDILGIL